MTRTVVGVLALQGDFARHRAALESLGVEVREVRRAEHLDGLAALFLPGGESTTMLRALAGNRLREPLEAFVRERPVFGTCAGVILLAREVEGALPVPPLGVLDVTVERNGYGRQVDSFSEPLEVPAVGGAVNAVFIRAPRIRRVGSGVEVIARRGGRNGAGEPVGVRAGNLVGLCFHPELTPDRRLQRWFLTEVAGIRLPDASGASAAAAPSAAPRSPAPAAGLIALGHSRAVAGLVAGGLLGLANMVWMVGTAKRFVGFAPTARMLQVAAAIRFLTIAVLLGVVLIVSRVDPVGAVIGYGCFPIAAAVAGWRILRAQPGVTA